MSKIFIPKTCRVGFQDREDTFAGKLAYVIYYDAKGKIRKEKSWEQWRHKPGGSVGYGKHARKVMDGIEPYDFPNEPTSGFVLNKGHTRYAWSHFGERRTVIRIYDPRGVEFEVTPENLVAILMHTDCSKREIQGELVYAWCGTELMLLPCSSEEYQSALNFSSLQGTRVSAKDLREGFTYVAKNEANLVYLGRRMWYEVNSPYDDSKRVGKKQHIFCDLDGKNVKPVKNVSATISKQASDGCHDEFANWVDAYLKSPESAKIAGWETKPFPDRAWDKKWDGPRHSRDASMSAVTREGENFVSVTIERHRERSQRDWGAEVAYKGPPRLSYRRHYVVREDGSSSRSVYNDYYCAGECANIVEDRSKFFVLYAIYENGLKKKWS